MALPRRARPAEYRGVQACCEEVILMSLFIWTAVALMLVGAVLLIAGVGAAGLWIGVVTVGVALVVADRTRRHHGPA